MWEWRAFAPRLAHLDHVLADAASEERADVYVLAEGLGPDRGLKLRGGDTLELKVLAAREGQAERWEKPFVAPLGLLSHQTRELSRLLAPGGPVPVRPLRGLDDVLRLVRDLRLGEARTVPVEKRVRAALVDGLRVERSQVRLAEVTLETVAVEGAEPRAVLGFVERLGVPLTATVSSFPALLAQGG